MRRFVGLTALLIAVPVMGCADTSGTGKGVPSTKATATMTELQGATASAPLDSAASGAVIPENSKIEFVGRKPGGLHNGGFTKFTVKVTGGDDITKKEIAVDIDTDSIFTDTPKLTNHLKTPDFFEVKKYPHASFVSTSIKPGSTGDATHTIMGDLELHGVKKSISFPAKITANGDAVAIESKFTINRKDFNMTWGGPKINDDIEIKVSVRPR